MYEMCYTAWSRETDHTLGYRRVDGAWESVQNSHLAALRKHKLFFCFAESPQDAASPGGLGDRMYTYASFLLSYEPEYSVLQESRHTTASGVPVDPETQLVAVEPRDSATDSIDTLRRGGAYVREFERCYLAQAPVGPCAAVVNPAGGTRVPWPLASYRRALRLEGGSIADGGRATFSARIPADLEPASAAIVAR
jgi:hypothetical protein